jgi:enamine deaminase RidA (YjgF/YER057c/UK114 family)
MIANRLQALGLTLPEPPRPVAAYIPAKRSGDIVYLSGQLPLKSGELMLKGPLHDESQIADAQAAMRQCFLNALAAAASVVSLDEIKGVLRLAAFVASAPEFTSQHLVANGASELALEIFGDSGRHCRTAIGVPCLPLNAAVELEVQFLL